MASDFASVGETRFRIDPIRQSPMPAILEIYREILLGRGGTAAAVKGESRLRARQAQQES